MKVRSEKIATMLKRFNRHVDTHIYKARTCKVRKSSTAQRCQAFFLGQLVRVSAGLARPLRPSASDFHCSAFAVFEILKAIKLRTYNESHIYGVNSKSHKECNIGPRMLKDINRDFYAAPGPTLDSHRIHMQAQWKKGNPRPGFD
jgi:hypothetical protein